MKPFYLFINSYRLFNFIRGIWILTAFSVYPLFLLRTILRFQRCRVKSRQYIIDSVFSLFHFEFRSEFCRRCLCGRFFQFRFFLLNFYFRSSRRKQSSKRGTCKLTSHFVRHDEKRLIYLIYTCIITRDQ